MEKFDGLRGKTLEKITGDIGDDEMFFTTTDGETVKLYYEYDCCASCDVVDIVGDLEDLVGNPLLLAEEVTNEQDEPPPIGSQESFTWTFYKLATIRGSVTISWYGESNGYYNESVSFAVVV